MLFILEIFASKFHRFYFSEYGMIGFPMRNENGPGEMPINDLMRMLQVQPRPDKDNEHQIPIGNGSNKEMNKVG